MSTIFALRNWTVCLFIVCVIALGLSVYGLSAKQASQQQTAVQPEEVLALRSGRLAIPLRVVATVNTMRVVNATTDSLTDRSIDDTTFNLMNVSDADIWAAVFVFKGFSEGDPIFERVQWFDSKLISGLSPVKANSPTTITFTGRQEFSRRITETQLIVDVVEFIDGTTAGEDKYKVSRRIADERRGARKAIDHIRYLYSGGKSEEFEKLLGIPKK